jgi:hypothetical protein
MSRNQIRRLDSLIKQPPERQLKEIKSLAAGPMSRRARRAARRILSDIQANETASPEVRQRAVELYERIPTPEVSVAQKQSSEPVTKESLPAPSRREPPEKTFGACDRCKSLGQLFWDGWDDPDADDLLELLKQLDCPDAHKRFCAVCFASGNQSLTEAEPRQ